MDNRQCSVHPMMTVKQSQRRQLSEGNDQDTGSHQDWKHQRVLKAESFGCSGGDKQGRILLYCGLSAGSGHITLSMAEETGGHESL